MRSTDSNPSLNLHLEKSTVIMKTLSDMTITQFTILWQHAGYAYISSRGNYYLKLGLSLTSNFTLYFCLMMDKTEQFFVQLFSSSLFAIAIVSLLLQS